MKITHNTVLTCLALAASGLSGLADAAIALDRTRVVFDGASKSISLRITNENKKLPFLAQGWIEDARGEKITEPLIMLPPVQRIEPGEQSQLKVQAMPSAHKLPQDRETLFYFNLREIPPKSTKPNTLQLALQTRVKLFYRPDAIKVKHADYSTPFQEQLTLTREGDKYRVNNPTPYYISLVSVASTTTGKTAAGFKPVMVEPKGQLVLVPSASALGSSPVLTYVNDFGGRVKLVYNCGKGSCTFVPQEKKK